MPVVITGNNTPTAGGVTYGDGSTYANTAAGAAGGVLYSAGSSAPAFSAAGTSGQLLQSNGASAPTWVTASSGAMVFLSSVTASASATVDVENTFSSTYSVYELVVSGMVPANDGEGLYVYMKIGGSYITTSSYMYHRTGSLSTSNSYVGANSGVADNAIIFANNVQNGASVPMNFKIRIYNPSSTALQKAITWEGYYQNTTTPAVAMSFGAGSNSGTDALTGIRFAMGVGNITSGTFRLYGIANS
jgi:hypothetical protein